MEPKKELLKILIVEDEESIRSLFMMLLDSHDFEVTTLGTASEAKLFIDDKKNEIDLCLFDLKLQDGDGFTLLDYTLSRFPDMPIIMMTGHGNKATKQEAIKRGAYEYIEKPFSIDTCLFPVLERAEQTIRLRKKTQN